MIFGLEPQPIPRATAIDAESTAPASRGTAVPLYAAALAQADAPIPRAWVEESPPEREQLLITDTGQDFLARGIVAQLIAAGGVGKTFLLCHLAASIASGRPWLEVFFPRRAGRVLLLLAEEDPLEVRRRLYRTFRALGLEGPEREAARQNVFAAGFASLDVALVATEPGAGRFDAPAETPWGAALLDWARDHSPWDLIAFDPASRWNGCPDENNNRGATLFAQALERFTVLPGRPTVVAAAHVAKSERTVNAPPRSARGASATFDAARLVVSAFEDRDGAVVLSVEKSNYARRPAPIRLLREPGGALKYDGIAPVGAACKARAGDDLAERVIKYLAEHPFEWRTGRQIRAAVGDISADRLAMALERLGNRVERSSGPRGSTLFRAASSPSPAEDVRAEDY